MGIEKKWNSPITGDIRYALFRYSLLAICLFSLVVLSSYIVTRRPWINVATMVTIIVLSLIFYRVSRNPNRYTPARLFLFILFTFFYLPFGFFTSPGSVSSMPGYIFFIIFMETILAVNKWEYAFPLISTAVNILLLRSELLCPDLFIPFESERQRILDLSINSTMVSFFIIFVTVFVMRKYQAHSNTLRRMSITDNLTGLYNRFYLEEEGRKEMNRSKRKSDPMTVMFIDLNNFKKINDSLGHQEGDKVLKDIGRIIRANTRDYDVPARFGGDEFVIILPSSTGETASRQIQRLDGEFSGYSGKYEKEQFSVSFGAADSDEVNTFSELLKLADKRLYLHKKEKKAGLAP